MRILFVLAHPIPSPSAAWTRVSFFAEFFKKRGDEVFVCGAKSLTLFRKAASIEKNIPFFRITYMLPFWRNPLITLLNIGINFVCLPPLLLLLRPKVVIVSIPPFEPCLVTFITSRLTRCRFIIDYRDESEDYLISLSSSKLCRKAFQFIKSLMGAIYRKSELVTAVTQNFVYNLKRRGVTKVRLVPNGADTGTFKPLSSKRESESFRVFYSGGIGGYYRLDVSVKAVKKLVDRGLRNFKLVIAGEGEIENVLNLALKLGVSSNIKYKGVINDKAKLAELVAKADVGLVPYDGNSLWKNSLPTKFYEYCACGIPVIATAYEDSLLATLIREYEIGVTSPPMDEEKLAEAIYRIYKDKSFREAAGKRARTLIEGKFDRNKIAEDFLKLIEAI